MKLRPIAYCPGRLIATLIVSIAVFFGNSTSFGDQPNANVDLADAGLQTLSSIDVGRPAAVKSIDQWLSEGKLLEDQSKFSEAVEHYEAAVRELPEDSQLYQRLIINRLRSDVIRRMNDRSYAMAMNRISFSQALDLYSEVLANLETHYVDSMDWQRVATFGTAALEVALVQPEFVEKLLPGTQPETIAEFHQSIHRELATRNRSTRFDLRATASYAATLAHQRLDLNPTAVVFEFLCGAVSTLDTYTRLLSPNQLDDMFSNIDGNFVGLGVELKNNGDVLDILSVIPHGPAMEAGLRAGQKIVAVDGISGADAGSNRIADLLRGPEHSTVRLTIHNADGSEYELTVPRRRVDVPCVDNDHFVDVANGVAYLRLTNFQKSTARDVEAKLWKLQRQQMKALIIDLRGNPGGLLSAAVELADRFLREGRIVTTRGRNIRENFDYVAHSPGTWDVPLALLIDEDSASASEIFAGAICDNRRGWIVGENSYGKGRVQGIFRMQTAKFGLCMTTSEFFSPSGAAINAKGIRPHVEVGSTYVSARPTDDGRIASDEQDAVLQAAIDSLTNRRPATQISQRP